MKFSAFFALCVLVLSPAIVHAQGIPSASIQGIDIVSSDDNPIPGGILNIHAESYSTDLNSANITWIVGGKTIQKGIGATSIQVQAPRLGKQVTVSVTATSPEGKTFSDSIKVTSGSVDLIVETDGYTQPFFDGKVALSYENGYRIIAIPHLAQSNGHEYNPKSLIYEWSKDSQVMADENGYGKQIFSWKEELIPRERFITVHVSSRDGSVQAEKSIHITATDPMITFYKDDPLYGPFYNTALDGLVRLGGSGETSVLAVPYGFNASSGSTANLSYAWLVNDEKQNDLNQSSSITLRAPNDAEGTSNISLQVSNQKEILQSAKGSFTVNFNKMTQTADNIQNYNGI